MKHSANSLVFSDDKTANVTFFVCLGVPSRS